MSINIKLKRLFYKSWKRNFTSEEITYVRILLYGVVLYKLLSRDFSNFGFIPEELLNFYLYQPLYPRLERFYRH